MPIPKDIADDRIGKPSPGDVQVFVDQYGGAKYFGDETIPLDGRKYQCDGLVIFKNGTKLRAKFNLIASKEQIVIDNVICFYHDLWYRNDEDDLFKALRIMKEEALPMMCLPDRNLSGRQGPFPISASRLVPSEPAPHKADASVHTRKARQEVHPPLNHPSSIRKSKMSLTSSYLLLAGLVILLVISLFFALKYSADKVGDGGFLSQDPCGPPCFLGIMPNVTNETEMVRILQEAGLYENCKFLNNESAAGLRSLNCLRHDVTVTFFPGTDIVGDIRFSLRQTITADMVIAKYGEPDAVFVSFMKLWRYSRPEIVMSLIYDHINTSVTLGSQKGDSFNLETSTRVTRIGYSKLGFTSVDEGQAGKPHLTPWHGYGEYVDLINP